MADTDSMAEEITSDAPAQGDRRIPAATTKATKDRRVKIGFLIVLVLAAAVIYYIQTRPKPPAGWPVDMDKALAKAKDKDRRILAFFMGDPVAFDAGRMNKTTLHQKANKQAIVDGKFVKVAILEGLKSDLLKQYKVETLPTMMVLAPDGTELNRQVGFIGEVSFRTEFLSYWRTDIDKALTRAKKRNRSLLVFFTGNPLVDDAKRMLRTTLQQSANTQALKESELVKVIVIQNLDSDLAKRYNVKSLPTMLLLGPSGKERNRREGFIEKTPFRTEFLNCKVIRRP